MKKSKLLLAFLLLANCLGYAQTATEKPLRFAFLTDLHVSPGIDSESGLESIVDEINRTPFDFVVVTGDVSNTGSNAELESVKRILTRLKHPFHVLPGNHETNWSESAGKTFLDHWKNDRFSFNHGRYFFIGFNTGPYMKMGDGHVKQEDLLWLKRELAEKLKPGMDVVSLAHYPIGDGLDNWFDVTAILKQYPTKLILCGHGHRLSLHNFDGITGVMGRSSLPKNTAGLGYNIITLQNDSVQIEEKIVGEAKPRLFQHMSLAENKALQKKISGPAPDYSINEKYAKHAPKFSYQDNASLFTAAVPAGKKAIAFGTSDGNLKLIDATTGKLLWKDSVFGSIYTNPLYTGEYIIAGTISGQLIAWNQKNGTRAWTLELNEPLISEPFQHNNLIYLGVGSGTMYCLDARDGKIIWSYKGIEGQLQARPALSKDGKQLVFGAWDTHLYCLDATNGELKWKWNNGSRAKLYSPGNVVPAIAGNKVIIVAPDRYMTAIDLQTGKTIWRNNQYRVRESLGISANGETVYAKTMMDTVIAVATSPDTMQVKWIVNAAFGYEHNPCPITVHNGVVFTGTKNGELVAIDEKKGQMLWKYKAGNSSINAIRAGKKDEVWISLIEGKIQRFNQSQQ